MFWNSVSGKPDDRSITQEVSEKRIPIILCGNKASKRQESYKFLRVEQKFLRIQCDASFGNLGGPENSRTGWRKEVTNCLPSFFSQNVFFSFSKKLKKTWSRSSYWRCVGAEDGEKMAREYRLQLFTPSKPIGSWHSSPWPQPFWRSPSCTAPSSWRPARRTGGTSWTHWSCWQGRCAPVRMLRWDKLVWRSVKYKDVWSLPNWPQKCEERYNKKVKANNQKWTFSVSQDPIYLYNIKQNKKRFKHELSQVQTSALKIRDDSAKKNCCSSSSRRSSIR